MLRISRISGYVFGGPAAQVPREPEVSPTGCTGLAPPKRTRLEEGEVTNGSSAEHKPGGAGEQWGQRC